MNTESDNEQVIKYNVALLATDSVSLEKKRRRLTRDIPSEATNHLSRFNEESDTKQGLTTQDEEIESAGSVDHGDAIDRQRYLHDKLIGAAND